MVNIDVNISSMLSVNETVKKKHIDIKQCKEDNEMDTKKLCTFVDLI